MLDKSPGLESRREKTERKSAHPAFGPASAKEDTTMNRQIYLVFFPLANDIDEIREKDFELQCSPMATLPNPSIPLLLDA